VIGHQLNDPAVDVSKKLCTVTLQHVYLFLWDLEDTLWRQLLEAHKARMGQEALLEGLPHLLPELDRHVGEVGLQLSSEQTKIGYDDQECQQRPKAEDDERPKKKYIW
jgi:hypothetical protein